MNVFVLDLAYVKPKFDLVSFFLSIYFQIFKSFPAGIYLVLSTITIYQIEVLAAPLAQAFAVFVTKELLRNIQQDLLACQLGQVKAVSLQLVGFEVRRVDLVFAIASQPAFGQVLDIEIDRQGLFNRPEASGTVDLDRSANVPLDVHRGDVFFDLSGHRVHTVHDGHAAVRVARQLQPEVALLDIGMPGLDGWEVARRIRALPGCEQTLLIALTGWGQAADRSRSREAGFDHHLVKPVDLATLRGLLRAHAANDAIEGGDTPIAVGRGLDA